MYESIPNLLFQKPNFYARHRIFFIPYAGAGASISGPYHLQLQPEIDLIALQFPGRENRIEEDPIDCMTSMIEVTSKQILPFLDMPFSFWGHCSGALIAYELINKINELVQVSPQRLIVSASAAPHAAKSILPVDYQSLSDIDFIDAIDSLMGNAFAEDAAQQQLVKIYLPGLRADFKLYENYHIDQPRPLECPIYALGGNQDKLVNQTHLEAWRNYSSSAFQLTMLSDAHHYFINSHINEVSHQLKACLQ